MKEIAKTEEEMRDAKAPCPKTEAELAEYIESLVDREHEYGTCVYAMSLAATAAFQYVASRLGVTGFQASCADLDVIRRTRTINGPFMLIKGEDALYPQYDLRGDLDRALFEWQPWLAEQAKEKIAKSNGESHPRVLAHWESLAKEPVQQ